MVFIKREMSVFKGKKACYPRLNVKKYMDITVGIFSVKLYNTEN